VKKIFISHDHSDKPFVHRLSRDLERFGYPVWIDEAEIKYGESLITKIHDAIKDADVIIVVISSTSVKSKWVAQEVELALNLQMGRNDISIIPILIDSVSPPLFLKSRLYADFRSTGNRSDPPSKSRPLQS
jgi:hypothetical protein